MTTYIRDFPGRILYRIEDDRICEFSGQCLYRLNGRTLYRIDGPISRTMLLAMIMAIERG